MKLDAGKSSAKAPRQVCSNNNHPFPQAKRERKSEKVSVAGWSIVGHVKAGTRSYEALKSIIQKTLLDSRTV